MVVYETFRSERFFQHLELLTNELERTEFITNWMRAAFEAGRNPGDKYI
jgi:hypothetical protein